MIINTLQNSRLNLIFLIITFFITEIHLIRNMFHHSLQHSVQTSEDRLASKFVSWPTTFIVYSITWNNIWYVFL